MSKNKPSWGNTPQESTTAATGGWGSAPQESTTSRPATKGSWGHEPQESTTGSVPKQRAAETGECPVYSFYILDGMTFTVRRVISDQSGEAIIFEVDNGGQSYALKLYRHGVVPNHEVLQRIMELRGNGLLVDIYAHGQWHDDIGGGDYHYEVMQHCCGGSLASVNLHGDEAKLREYATRMAAAVDFAHANDVLHRDVKPANFMFVDKEQTRFVLTDWGMAKMLDSDRRTVTDANRTKIYAAPEMYTYIPGTPTYVGVKADFFSLGMTLMALWMGEGRLLADETRLVHDKQEETLPYPPRGDMSDHMIGLIKALTRRNPEVRAGFDEIIRWSKGECIFQEKSDDSLAEFKIVFNATAGLIAHNPKELSDMMWANQDLATKYLYSDKIAQWFRDIERPELAMAMEDITENKFPGNPTDGLFAACLTLNPEMPFPFSERPRCISVNTIEELGEALGNGTLTAEHVTAMASETFLMWAATRNPMLAGKAMKNPQNAWHIVYSLLPDVGYDFRPIGSSRLATPEQFARQIVYECGPKTRAGANDNDPHVCLLESLDSNWASSRLHAYLASKGIYTRHISWIGYCLDLDSKDNRLKFVPYTLRVARLKAAAGLMGSVPPITVGTQTFAVASDVENADTDNMSSDNQDILADWLSLFYQEAPDADYKEKTYLRRSSEYADALDNLPACTYSSQSEDATSDINISLQLYNKNWRKVVTWRWIAGFCGFLPLLLVCVAATYLTITMGALDFSGSLAAVGYWVGIVVGGLVFLGLLGKDSGLIMAGICGVVSYVLIKLAFAFLGFIVPWLVIGLLLLALVFLGKNVFSRKGKHFDDHYTDLEWDEAVDRYFVGIRFSCLDKVFPMNVPDDYPLCVIDESTQKAATELGSVRKSALFMLGIALVGGALCWFTSKSPEKPQKMNVTPAAIELLQGIFQGDIEGTPATIDFNTPDAEKLQAVMSIDYRSGATRQTMTAQMPSAFPVVLPKEGNHEIYLRVDTAYADGATTVVRGVYCNSKKNLRKVNLEKK